MPIARFQMPDGRVARFEVPEGTTPDQAQQHFEQWSAGQAKPRKTKQEMLDSIEAQTPKSSRLGSLVAGAVQGAGDIGATIVSPGDWIADKLIGDRKPGMESRNEERRRMIRDGLSGMGADVDSGSFTAGRIGAQIAGTAGAGGAVANSLRAVPVIANSARLAPVVDAVATSGMRAGGLTGNSGMGARVAGGAVAGGAQMGMVDPGDVGTGAAVGGALPVAGKAVYAAGKGIAKSATALVKPMTEKGQLEIATKVLLDQAKGGPTAIRAREIIPGSRPTLAQSTGNAGIAGMERVARDKSPNSFVELSKANSQARADVLGNLVKQPADVAAMEAQREAAVSALYNQAKSSSLKIDGSINGLMARPGMQKALARAQELANNEGAGPIMQNTQRRNMVGGKLPSQDSYLTGTGMHYLKMALDDMGSGAVEGIGKNEARAFGGMKNELLGWAEKTVPEYGQARKIYSEMSKPIEAQRYLQSIGLTNANGDLTLAKVDSAIKRIAKDRVEKGLHPAKSISAPEMRALIALRADLRREAKSGLGKSAGSDTFQRAATNATMGDALPPVLRPLVKPGSFGNNAIARLLQLPYGGADKAVQEKMHQMLLDPSLFQQALKASGANASQPAQNALRKALTMYGSPAGTVAIAGAGTRSKPVD